MFIKDLKLSGFKVFDVTQGLDLESLPEKEISLAKGGNKRFLFHAILGIIYGLAPDELQRFRSIQGSKVFTGRLTLSFGEALLHIERDFGTDIIAVLSQREGRYKSIFQGKDVLKPHSSRPYLEILSSFFTITDKEFIIDVCERQLNSNETTLADLLDTLHLFLRPRFRIAAIRRVIGSCQQLLKKEDDPTLEESVSDKIMLLKRFKKLRGYEKNIADDIERYRDFWDTLDNDYDERSQINENLKQRFPLIYHMDAMRVKSEIEQLLTLKNEANVINNHLQKVNQKMKSLDETVQSKLLVYADLPDSFEDDFQTFQALSMDVADIKNQYDRFTIEAGKSNATLRRYRSWEKSYYIAAVGIGLISGLIFFSTSPLLIVAFLAVLMGGGVFVFHKMKKNALEHLEYLQGRQDKLRKKIQQMEMEISTLRQKSYLLDDLELIDQHIENFKQYRKIQALQEKLKKHKWQYKKQLNAPKFRAKENLEKKYHRLINLQRSDLMNYIHEFENAQKMLEKNVEFKGNSSRLEPVKQTIKLYDHLLTQIAHTRETIKKHLDIHDLDDNVETYLARADEEKELLMRSHSPFINS